MLKISSIAAADARRTPAKRSNNHFLDAAQAVQVLRRLPVFFCTEICGKASRFSREIAKVSMKFDAHFEDHARPAPSEMSQKTQACSTHCFMNVCCLCARASRVARSFCNKTAQFFGRKARDFCVEILENPRDRSRRRTQNTNQTLRQSFYASCARHAGLPELSSA